MCSKENIKEKWEEKKNNLGKVEFWQVQIQALMDFLITQWHTVIGKHLPKAQRRRAGVTSTLDP